MSSVNIVIPFTKVQIVLRYNRASSPNITSIVDHTTRALPIDVEARENSGKPCLALFELFLYHVVGREEKPRPLYTTQILVRLLLSLYASVRVVGAQNVIWKLFLLLWWYDFTVVLALLRNNLFLAIYF